MENGADGSFWQNFGLLIPIIIIIIFGVLKKRRGGGKTRLEVAVGLLSETNHNLKIMDAFSSNWRVQKKFKTGNWNRNQDKIDFLDQELQNNLADAFDLAEDFNERIAEAKQHKSTSYLAGIQADKLREPLTKSKEGLTEWVQANFQTEMSQRRRRGLFG